MEINIPKDLDYWLGVFKIIVVSFTVIFITLRFDYIVEVFKDVPDDLSAIMFWALLLIFLVQFLKVPRRNDV